MKRLQNFFTQRKILIYFLVAIAAPCFALLFLAFRGIQNDHALIEKQNRTQAEGIGKEIIAAVESHLDSIEKSFFSGITVNPQQIFEIFSDTSLARLSINKPLVSGVFFVNSSGKICILDHHLQYLPNGALRLPESVIPAFEKTLLDEGEKFEFRKNNLLQALKFYSKIEYKIISQNGKIQLFNNIARLQKRTGLQKEAMHTYRTMMRVQDGQYIGQFLPAELVALKELSQLSFQQNNYRETVDTIITIFKGIIDRRWLMDERSYTFILDKTSTLISDLVDLKRSDLYESLILANFLEQRIKELQTHTETLIAFKENADELINSRLSENQYFEKNRSYRFEQAIAGSTKLISIYRDSSGFFFCMLLDPMLLSRDYVIPKLMQSLGNSKWTWKLEDSREQLIAQSDTVLSASFLAGLNFSAGLPKWSLDLYSEPSSMMQSFLISGRSIYVYIFILIVIVLTFGIVFTLQAMNHQLEINHAKSNFIDSVSHDFKSPLTSIRQMVEMLYLERVPDPFRKKEYYLSIQRQSEHLTKLVNNVIDFSKLDKGKRRFDFQLTNMSKFFKSIEEELNDKNLNEVVQMRFQVSNDLPKVKLDQEGMRQVLYNLVDNAIKYSGDSKFVDIEVHTSTNRLEIVVQDYGVGISDFEKSKIFEKYYRSKSQQSGRIKGSGIGLNIVKEIVSAHNGKVSIQSQSGMGSRFIVDLPLHQN